MVWAAIGLSRDPFQRSPELDDACLPNTIAAMLSEMMSDLRSSCGVSMLVAEAGSGKTMAAHAFARRVAGVAHVVLLERPTSSISAIARAALEQLGAGGLELARDDEWVTALRERVDENAAGGRATAILLDDAHRLSPQTLDDLARLFGDGRSSRLHLFLFGRPRLLDRMNAGAEGALDEHLLQVFRLDPLGVRESVRYLERRLAICGGELARLCNDEAIDEIVQRAEGRLVRLEELAAEALRRAGRRGASRASVEDVVATARHAAAEEEEVMATHQQTLRFALTDDEAADGPEGWEEDDARHEAVEWGDEDSDDEEEWQAEDDADEQALTWDSAPHRLDEDELDDEDESEDGFGEPRASTAPAARRRLMGPAVLSLGACLALVWAANHVPGPSSDAQHGRDAKLFAERLSSEPSQILRLARTAEAADADAQVQAWLAQPPRPVEEASQRAQPVEKEARGADPVAKVEPAAPAQPASPDAKATPQKVAVSASSAGILEGPPEPVAAAAPKEGKPKAEAVAATPAKKPPVQTAKAAAPARKTSRSSDPVYTVQLGAFKARRNAEELAGKLRGKPAHILQEGGLYRVVSGSFASKRDAAVHEASLKRAGYTTYVRTAVF